MYHPTITPRKQGG